MAISDRIRDLIGEAGVGFKEKTRTIYTRCPMCGRDDKFSILKENGSCICYRGSCSFGRRWFPEWLSMSMSISIEEAKQKFYGFQQRGPSTEKLELSFDGKYGPKIEKSPLDDLKPIVYPEYHMIGLDLPEAHEGVDYCASRGIPLAIARKYDILYSIIFRRIIFPIKINGLVYGYQGRAIDTVSEGNRMRNNNGFRRDTLVMFADNLKDSKHAIICEGPVNAIKFDRVGGAIATMGKVVTEKQIEIILSYGVESIYLALDDDAAKEMNKLVETLPVSLYKLEVPESCKIRCSQLNKKADFGECTFEECEQAFRTAQPTHPGQLFVYLK